MMGWASCQLIAKLTCCFNEVIDTLKRFKPVNVLIGVLFRNHRVREKVFACQLSQSIYVLIIDYTKVVSIKVTMKH